MAKSKSKKIREKQAKTKGMDIHSLRRGSEGIDISLVTKKTKTKKEKLEAELKKEKVELKYLD